MKKIFYDPNYNFHIGYHNELIQSTKNEILWKKASLVNKYEFCLRSKSLQLRKCFISEGYFKSISSSDLIFSPHVFLLNKNPYFLEIEDIYWFFADTYEEVYESTIVPEWKKIKMEEHFISKNLIHIFWWSKAAFERFKLFCKINKVSSDVINRVIKISSILYPSSLIIHRKKIKRKKKKIIAVFDENNFYRKGGDIILFLLKRLSLKKIDNYFFKIFGYFSSHYYGLIDKFKNAKIVFPVERTKFQKELANSDIFIFPSRADTFGTVLINAMNAGCFIISSYGDTVFASKEILSGYPYKILIKNDKINKIYGEPNKNKFLKALENILKEERERKIINWESKFTREKMRESFLNFINIK